jgi:hypothetical protein
MNKTFPDKVPVFEAKHMCKRRFNGPNGRRCLAGWHKVVFGTSNSTQAYEAIQDVAGVKRDSGIASFNDARGRRLSTLANVWNRAIVALGYVRRGKSFVKPKATK